MKLWTRKERKNFGQWKTITLKGEQENRDKKEM